MSGVTFAAGNVVKLTIAVTSVKAASVVIENVTTGETVTKSLTSSRPLCEWDAEWIVEDAEDGGSLAPFADFGAITWSNACAATGTNSCVGLSGNAFSKIEESCKVVIPVYTTSNTITCEPA